MLKIIEETVLYMDLHYLDRKRWVILFDILAKKILDRPATVEEIYEEVLRQKDRLMLDVSLQELREILNEFERRGIIKFVKDNNNTKAILTEEAKYFVLIYNTSFIGL